MNTRNLVAEFIGTFTLIFIGAGSVVINPGNLVAVALAFGSVVVAFVYAYGHISGAHINPAVTLALLIAGEIGFTAAIGYWIVQFAGGILGAYVLKGVLPVNGDLGVTILAANVTPLNGLIVEIILTFFLVNTIFNTAVSGKAGNLAGLAIGLTLVFCILMGGPLTRASLNPARTLGPAIAAGAEHAQWGNIWLYFVGPFIGAVLAALLYIGILKDKDAEDE
ncbi:MAG: aquaporin [Candidatus Poribacteria bacterium]|nr:aquaporin [Candidatus Poribacteria bacterium]